MMPGRLPFSHVPEGHRSIVACLVLALALPFFRIPQLSFWEGLRLGFMGVGLAIIVWREWDASVGRRVRLALIALVLIFGVLAFRPGDTGVNGWVMWIQIGCFLAAGLMWLGNRSHVPLPSRKHTWIALACVAAVAAGHLYGLKNVTIWSGLGAIALGGLYVFPVMMARVLTDREGAGRVLLGTAAVLFVVLALAVFVRGAAVVLDVRDAGAAARGGDYDSLQRWLASAVTRNVNLTLPGYDLAGIAKAVAADIASGPEPAEGHEIIGDLALGHGDLETAAAAYREAIALRGESRTYAQLAEVLRRQGTWEAAIEVCSKGLERHDGSAALHLQMALMLVRRGHNGQVFVAEALEHVRTAVDLVGIDVLQDRLSPGEPVRLADLIELSFAPWINRFSMYEAGKLAQLGGLHVVYGAARIGGVSVHFPVEVVVYSAGGGTWSTEKIQIDGADFSPEPKSTYSGFRRGINAVVIHPTTGKVVSRRNFDTWGDRHRASGAFSRFIDDVADGHLVVTGVRGDGGSFLSGTARNAFRKIGAVSAPKPGWSHAVIGIKGAGPGTAMEATAQDVHVVLGMPRASKDASAEVLRRALDNGGSDVGVLLQDPLSHSLIMRWGVSKK